MLLYNKCIWPGMDPVCRRHADICISFNISLMQHAIGMAVQLLIPMSSTYGQCIACPRRADQERTGGNEKLKQARLAHNGLRRPEQCEDAISTVQKRCLSENAVNRVISGDVLCICSHLEILTA